MKMIWVSVTVLSVLAIIGLSTCYMPLPTYRYRMTVEVDTPEGLKTGSSVIEVQSWDQGHGFPGPEAGGIRTKVRGEAVAVDLPNGQTLFALLRSAKGDVDAASRYAWALLPEPPDKTKPGGRTNINALKAIQGRTALAPKDYPMLVRFKDINDPKTVELVEPSNLEAHFGEGAKLKSISVEATYETVTSEIAARLRWFDQVRGALFHISASERPPTGTPFPLHATLTELDFQQGDS